MCWTGYVLDWLCVGLVMWCDIFLSGLDECHDDGAKFIFVYLKLHTVLSFLESALPLKKSIMYFIIVKRVSVHIKSGINFFSEALKTAVRHPKMHLTYQKNTVTIWCSIAFQPLHDIHVQPFE